MPKEISQSETSPEQHGDKLMAEGKFKEAEQAYGQAFIPWQGVKHMENITEKQTRARQRRIEREGPR